MSDECDYRMAKDKRVEIEESWGIAQLQNNVPVMQWLLSAGFSVKM